MKDKTAEQAEAVIMQAIALGQDYQARLFINDFWQLTVKHRAYACICTRKIWMRSAMQATLGISPHDDMELARAVVLKPSDIILGHIFPIQTKEMPSAPQGVSKLKRHVDAL
ncbi:MAG: thiamine phosphate synthase [Candidatus Malihini olakiniferum]